MNTHKNSSVTIPSQQRRLSGQMNTIYGTEGNRVLNGTFSVSKQTTWKISGSIYFSNSFLSTEEHYENMYEI